MPRTARADVGGYCYHVWNRGNGRSEVFHTPDDYRAFVRGLREASLRLPMRLLGYCLMPNHFHLVLWPHHDGDMGRWMHWLMTAHVRRYLRHTEAIGHVWQGRFKSFPIQADDHLHKVLRHVERNPVRAGLVARAQEWPWSSLAPGGESPALDPSPAPRGPRWLEWVHNPITEAEATAIAQAIQRDRPYGSESWTRQTASQLGLEYTLRPRGRPRGSDSLEGTS